jgi:adenylate kinase family enzyme
MLERLLHRGKTSGRIDDNIDVIKKRFETYNNETKPVIDYFKSQNRAVIVNAEGSVDETFKLVSQQIDSKII